MKARPRTKPAAERREDLMNTAERLFVEQGFGNTSVAAITAAAGVAKGTFYLYFKSKEDLRIALGDRFAQRHLASIEKAVGRHAAQDWHVRLAKWIRASATFYLDSIRLHDVLFHEARSMSREGLIDNIVVDNLAELLRNGAAAGAWRIHDARAHARFIFSGLQGVIDDAYVTGRPVSRARLIRRLERICLEPIGATPRR
jgi:AcrR family transcriptional regulator